MRCIKRGLQNSCHDGTRKKAKYLHDAPNEALMPAARIIPFNDPDDRGASMTAPAATSLSEAAPPGSHSQAFYPLDQAISPQGYDTYAQGGMAQSMVAAPPPPPPPPSSSRGLSSRQSPTTPGFPPGASQPPVPTASAMYLGGMAQSSPVSQAQAQNGVGGSLYDPHDPSAYNFDLASMNFGNHYGALEFGMLGHMSSAAMGSPPDEDATGLDQAQVTGTSLPPGSVMSPGFAPSPSSAAYIFPNDTTMADWHRPGGGGGTAPADVGERGFARNGSIAHGYTIGNGIGGYPDAAAVCQGYPVAFTGNASGPHSYVDGATNGQGQAHAEYANHASNPAGMMADLVSSSGAPNCGNVKDASTIYDSVTEPYSYTAGFHALTDYLQRRFPPNKRLPIAKALASVRPSFISCANSLAQEDLIFMEKCFQRMLWEYENFIGACATPTVVCRRTGEVAAVGNEFTILTGWRKDVLLGREANLNINIGGGVGVAAAAAAAAAGNGDSSSSRGFTTPRGATATSATATGADATKLREGLGPVPVSAVGGGNGRPQSVFLAELLDDDSVIKFYEDFAKLGFCDSRGSVTTRCRLLKYKTREDVGIAAGRGGSGRGGRGSSSDGEVHRGAAGEHTVNDDGNHANTNAAAAAHVNHVNNGNNVKPQQKQMYNQQQQQPRHVSPSASATLSKGGIADEGSIHRLESHDGTVECICCWTVRRDVFDMPMLIVMNVRMKGFLFAFPHLRFLGPLTSLFLYRGGYSLSSPCCIRHHSVCRLPSSRSPLSPFPRCLMSSFSPICSPALPGG